MVSVASPSFLSPGSYRLSNTVDDQKFLRWKTDMSSRLYSSLAGSVEDSARDVKTSLNEVKLGASYTVNVGFFTNWEMIHTLLGVIVQLALFGNGEPLVSVGTSPPSEDEQRMLGWKHDVSQSWAPIAAEIECQTEFAVSKADAESKEDRHQTPLRRPRKSTLKKDVKEDQGRVRIGGGYHIFKLATDEQMQQQHEAERGRSVSPGSHAEPACVKALRDKSSHAFVHGEVPEASDADRYRVGMHFSTNNLGNPSQSSLIYRVLAPVKHHESETFHSPADPQHRSLSESPRASSSTSDNHSHLRANMIEGHGEVLQGQLRPRQRHSPDKHAANTMRSRTYSAPHLRHSAQASKSESEGSLAEKSNSTTRLGVEKAAPTSAWKESKTATLVNSKLRLGAQSLPNTPPASKAKDTPPASAQHENAEVM